MVVRGAAEAVARRLPLPAVPRSRQAVRAPLVSPLGRALDGRRRLERLGSVVIVFGGVCAGAL